jgi:hypothetical protein
MKSADVPSERPDAGNLDENEVSTNQQALPVPLFAGEASLALHWLCNPYNQFTREAPAERPGKK